MNETTLTHLSQKAKVVQVHLLTKTVGKQLKLNMQKANEQYVHFEAKTFTLSNEHILIIGGKEVYHLGASLKDLSKKWFAFLKWRPNRCKGL